MSDYDDLLEGIRELAHDAERGGLAVADDYDYDSSKHSAGPRKAIALIGLEAVLPVSFRIPVELVPDGYVFSFGRTGELLLGCDDDPQPVLLEALGDGDALKSVIWNEIDRKHKFKTKAGLSAFKQNVGYDTVVTIPVKHTEQEIAEDFALKHTGLKIMVECTIRLTCEDLA